MPSWIDTLRPTADPSSRPGRASTPGTMAEAERILGAPAAAWAVETAAAITAEVETTARDDADLVLTGLERQACEAWLLTVLSSVALGRNNLAAAPEEAAEQVRLAVRQGVELDSVVRLVWACHTAVQDRLLCVVSDVTPPKALADEVRVLSRHLLLLAGLIVRELSAIYAAERAAWHDRIAATRRRIVDEIVRTGRAPDSAEQVLGIPLTGHHISGVLWRAGDPVEQKNAPLSHYAHRVAGRIGAGATLVLARAYGSTSITWTLSAAPPPDALDAVRTVARPAGYALALGPIGTAVRGFRHALLGAEQATAVGRRHGTVGAWTYDEVALPALLTTDPDAAGRYVRTVLDGLTARDPKTTAIRATLAAYLRHGRSRQAAARELRLATNTVAYRVRQAEDLLDRPATDRAADTVTALLLTHEFPDLLDEHP